MDPLAAVRVVLRWLLRLVDATALCAVHVAIASALFLLSGFLLAQAEPDAVTGGHVVRGLAAIWMWSALWHFVWRGVLQRPRSRASGQQRASGVRAAVGALGCLGAVAAIVAIYVLAGPWADWAYAGLAAEDMAHPVWRALDRALVGFDAFLGDPQRIRRTALSIGGVIAAYAILSALAREPAAGALRRGSPSAAVGSKPGPKPSAASMDDPVLGRLLWDARAGGWRPAERREGLPKLVVRTDGAPPTDAQRGLARTLVQRPFEVLLRGSEAARLAATADGVGLPRFTLTAAVVEPDPGGGPAVTLTLRCEGDAGRTYTVRSVDGLDTFTVR